jgi:hypothetical protein
MLLGGGGFFLYGMLRKPDLVAILLFTLIIADINFDLPGLPLNLRATITIALFARIYGELNASDHPGFFSNPQVWHLMFFVIWILLVSQFNGLFDFTLFKEFILSFLSAALAYYYFFKHKNHEILKKSMILGGLICLADLAYTYAFCGGFPVRRVYFLFTGADPSYNNHNFFGYICGTCFVFLLKDYLTNTIPRAAKMSLWMMPPMFLGVLLSTSRGALVAMILVTVFLIGKALSSRAEGSGKKAATLITITLVCLLLALFIFQIAASLGIQSDFMETMTGRLVDEPIAMFNKMLGNKYNAGSMDSAEWREEASSLAYKYFMSLPPADQMMGIGYGGFLARDIGNGYDAHNGVLLLLIETGVIGSLIYTTLVLSFWSKVRSLNVESPAFVAIVFIILYITSHNKEITSFFAFLIMGSLIAELRYSAMPHEEVTEEEQLASMELN